jgi:hypothetical protein
LQKEGSLKNKHANLSTTLVNNGDRRRAVRGYAKYESFIKISPFNYFAQLTLISRSGVLLQNLTVTRQVNKPAALSVTRNFITGHTEQTYEGASKSFRTGRLERELQMV